MSAAAPSVVAPSRLPGLDVFLRIRAKQMYIYLLTYLHRHDTTPSLLFIRMQKEHAARLSTSFDCEEVTTKYDREKDREDTEREREIEKDTHTHTQSCLLYTSPSPRD